MQILQPKKQPLAFGYSHPSTLADTEYDRSRNVHAGEGADEYLSVSSVNLG
jgi:hypothetical protein